MPAVWSSTVFGVSVDKLGDATRHKFATDLLARTENLRVVQTAMRHASPTTTAIYTLVEDASVRAAVAGLPVPA